MAESMLDLEDLQNRIRAFALERDWEQFHTPKNLTTALMCEAAELGEIFQWLTPAESTAVMEHEESAEAVRDEIADVFVYLLRMVDELDIDLQSAVLRKLEKNAAKYPVELARGSREKYTTLQKQNQT